jgi:type II secretory pathway pseudopilin PulG
MARIERESINFKLPKPLTAALRKVARERNTTATDLVIEGLHHVLGSVPGTESGVETRLAQLEEQLNHLANSTDKRVDSNADNRLNSLEQKLEEFALQLAKIEGAIATLGQRSYANNRRQSFNYHPPQLELQPYTGENLAKRLGVDITTLTRERENQSESEFESWCRRKDPSPVGWRYEKDGLYHPVK